MFNQSEILGVSLVSVFRIVLLNLPPMLIMHALSCFMGLILLAYYSTAKCDPLENKNVGNSNQVSLHCAISIFGSF